MVATAPRDSESSGALGPSFARRVVILPFAAVQGACLTDNDAVLVMVFKYAETVDCCCSFQCLRAVLHYLAGEGAAISFITRIFEQPGRSACAR